MIRLALSAALLALSALFLAAPGPPVPPDGVIEGVVTDQQTGEPLPGVNVLIVSRQRGASTDLDGRYRIDGIPAGAYQLRVSYVGYQTVQRDSVVVTAGATQRADFALAEDSQGLDEVVVESRSKLREAVGRLFGRDQAATEAGAPMPSSWNPSNMSARSGAALGQGYASDAMMPPPHSREGYAAREENGFQRPGQHPFSTFGVDVDRAGYANVRRFLNDGRLPVPGAVRLEEMVNYFAYELPQPVRDSRAPFSLTTDVAACPWQPGHRLVRIALQGREVDARQVPPSHLVFLLDTSGSMSSPDKLPLLVAGMKMLVQQLRPEDSVALVTYAGSAGLVLEPTPATPDGKQAIVAALERLSAGGSTAGGAGIELAYSVAEQFHQAGAEQNVRVILATDGDFNIGASSNAEMLALIEQKRETGVFLSVLGLGTGNLQDEKMELLADHGNGQYAYLDSIDEARRVLVSEMAGTLFAIAKDVKVRVEFNPARVAALSAARLREPAARGRGLRGRQKRRGRNRRGPRRDGALRSDSRRRRERGAGQSAGRGHAALPAGSRPAAPTPAPARATCSRWS